MTVETLSAALDRAVRAAASERQPIPTLVPIEACSVVALARTMRLFDAAFAAAALVSDAPVIAVSICIFEAQSPRASEVLGIWAAGRNLVVHRFGERHPVVAVGFPGGEIRVHTDPAVL